MSQSLTKIYLHIVFHLKTTCRKIRPEDIASLHRYIGKVVNIAGCQKIRLMWWKRWSGIVVVGLRHCHHIMWILRGKVDMVLFRLVNRKSIRWFVTCRTKRNTIRSNPFGMSISSSFNCITLNMTRNTYGAIDHLRCCPYRAHPFYPLIPRALPWAVRYCHFVAFLLADKDLKL